MGVADDNVSSRERRDTIMRLLLESESVVVQDLVGSFQRERHDRTPRS